MPNWKKKFSNLFQNCKFENHKSVRYCLDLRHCSVYVKVYLKYESPSCCVHECLKDTLSFNEISLNFLAKWTRWVTPFFPLTITSVLPTHGKIIKHDSNFCRKFFVYSWQHWIPCPILQKSFQSVKIANINVMAALQSFFMAERFVGISL